MNWDDPVSRAQLIERVGVDEYNRQFQEHHKKSIVATVGKFDIWPVNSKFGRLYMIGGLNRAYRTLDEAKKVAAGAQKNAT